MQARLSLAQIMICRSWTEAAITPRWRRRRAASSALSSRGTGTPSRKANLLQLMLLAILS